MELWFLYALGAAVFAALTTILAKIGVTNVDSHVATAIRTTVVLIFAWAIVFSLGSFAEIPHIQSRTWVFLILSGLATGGSWLCFLYALKIGDVNKVTPISKSSTILTMILAFIILSEPMSIITIIGMVLMGVGTWLMLELKKGSAQKNDNKWIVFAVLTAVFASLTAIFGRLGVVDIDPNLFTALRTIVILPLSIVMVLITKSSDKIKSIDKKSWVFLTLSGLATGASWLFFYHALQMGNASLVVPIDKLSIVITMLFARIFLGERFTKKSLLGLILLTTGTLSLVI